MNLGDCNGGTPLSYAIEKRRRSVVKLLLARTTSIDGGPGFQPGSR
jgi:ankyrin repeat protein